MTTDNQFTMPTTKAERDRVAADLTPESFDCLWAELERYRRNPLNLTTDQLAEIERMSIEHLIRDETADALKPGGVLSQLYGSHGR
jgi:hypothetical protein